MRSFVYFILFLSSAHASVVPSASLFRGWPPVVRRWSPAGGMVLAAAAYLAAPTPGQEKWALVPLGMNAVVGVYVVVRSLVRSWTSSRSVDGTE